MTGVSAESAAGWLHRRAGFGLHPDELETRAALNGRAALDDLLNQADDQPDPWRNLEGPIPNRIEAILAWFQRFITTTAPYVDRRTLMLHGWLVSSSAIARVDTMIEQLQLYMQTGGGSYPELLRAVTVDRAMLTYLDGRTSTARAPNENYGRELLELFALGVGEAPDGSEQPYTEDDVKAAAIALTGWTFRRTDPVSRFVAGRHDDTPQTLLGTSGVHDVDTVVDAVVSHPEHPRFVARRLAAEYVGDINDPRLAGVVDDLVEVYDSSGRSIDDTIRAALEIGLDGRSSPIVLAPTPWVAITTRALGINPLELLRSSRNWLRAAGHIPMLPPSVKGWDGGAAWFTASSLIGRANIADNLVAAADENEPLIVAADNGDFDEVARLVGLREPFGQATTDAIRAADTPKTGLVLALISPENLLS